jgi:ABC-type nitrate/sulfonate/bicarbonate transport system substrate-binding protein
LCPKGAGTRFACWLLENGTFRPSFFLLIAAKDIAMKTFRLFSDTLKVAGAALLFATSLTAHSQEVVNFGVQPSTQPIYIAREAGLLDPIEKKYNVQITFQSFAYGAPQNQALAAGAIELSSAGMGPAIVAASRLPAQLLGISILEQTAIIVPIDSPIKTVADLKGANIAFPGRGSQQYPLLLKALADNGLTESDVTLFKTNGSNVPGLVGQGNVDAGIVWDPHVSNALASGDARVLIKAEEILPLKAGHYIGNGVYGRTDFIKANPELTEDILVAIIKAIQIVIDDPNRAIAMWSESLGFPEEVVRFSIEQGISVYNTDIVPTKETIDAYTVFLKEAGILQADDNPNLATDIAKAAYARAIK